MITLRTFDESDWLQVWNLLAPVFRAGETYAFSPDITETEARAVWIDAPDVTYVAQGTSGAIVGTYFLKPNQPGLGSHVCNCGYIVSEDQRGKGLASLMCEHSQVEARRLGFRAMQFNFVVTTNTGAVRLWQRHGFAIVCRLPGVFRHPTQGYVDAFIMFKQLATF